MINKYLLSMGFFVNFNIDENFEESIKSRYRDDFSYQSFSEGEKMKIDLAILFAWRGIAKMKNSVNTNILILDEIQSGYGRSGSFFAFQKSGIQPDIISMAKGMGNGFPIGGILLHPRFKAKHGLLGTTFGGSHLACAAGIAVLEVIRDEKLMENAAVSGQFLLNELKNSALPGVIDVRGDGLMIGIEFDYNTAALRKKMLMENHIFTGSSSDPNTIRLLPSLSVGENEIDQLLDGFKSVLYSASQSVPV
jgi:acetylornithine aminotransferase